MADKSLRISISIGLITGTVIAVLGYTQGWFQPDSKLRAQLAPFLMPYSLKKRSISITHHIKVINTPYYLYLSMI